MHQIRVQQFSPHSKIGTNFFSGKLGFFWKNQNLIFKNQRLQESQHKFHPMRSKPFMQHNHQQLITFINSLLPTAHKLSTNSNWIYFAFKPHILLYSPVSRTTSINLLAPQLGSKIGCSILSTTEGKKEKLIYLKRGNYTKNFYCNEGSLKKQ